MERVSLAVETDPGLTKRAIRDAVRGKATAVDLARELLIAEGFIEARAESEAARAAVRHYSVKPYREAEGS
jgi:hypothetical protein